MQNGYSRVDWGLGGKAPRKNELQRRQSECDKVEEYDDPKPHGPGAWRGDVVKLCTEETGNEHDHGMESGLGTLRQTEDADRDGQKRGIPECEKHAVCKEVNVGLSCASPSEEQH